MQKMKSNSGEEFIILEKSGKNCKIKFLQTGHVRKANYDNLVTGKVKDPYSVSVYGIGYIGEYDKVFYWKRAKQLWRNMLKRCYSGYEYAPSYKDRGVIVDPAWHCFGNFLRDLPKLKGFNEWLNGHDGVSERYNLDKDFMIPNCEIYSLHTCCFIHESINKADGATRGTPYTRNVMGKI